LERGDDLIALSFLLFSWRQADGFCLARKDAASGLGEEGIAATGGVPILLAALDIKEIL
jgi:hypothetical protein